MHDMSDHEGSASSYSRIHRRGHQLTEAFYDRIMGVILLHCKDCYYQSWGKGRIIIDMQHYSNKSLQAICDNYPHPLCSPIWICSVFLRSIINQALRINGSRKYQTGSRQTYNVVGTLTMLGELPHPWPTCNLARHHREKRPKTGHCCPTIPCKMCLPLSLWLWQLLFMSTLVIIPKAKYNVLCIHWHNNRSSYEMTE